MIVVIVLVYQLHDCLALEIAHLEVNMTLCRQGLVIRNAFDLVDRLSR